MWSSLSMKILKNILCGTFFVLSYLISYATASRDNSRFLDNTFWDNKPETNDIISALYWTNSIYTSNWTWYDSNSCQNMSVKYVSTLPTTLSGNTIYVLTWDLVVTGKISYSKCSAIVWIWNIGITIDFDSWFVFYSDKEYIILDNIKINSGTKHCWFYGWHNNITLNNISITNLSAWIVLENVNHSYSNNINISNNYRNNSDYGDWDWFIIISGTKNIVKNIVSHNNYYWVELYKNTNYNNIENITTYNNATHWLFITTNSNYNEIKNIYSYNNWYDGVYLLTSNYNVLNNWIIFNNWWNGIGFRKSLKNSVNNVQIFNNWKSNALYCWINFFDQSNYNIINNSLIYNNHKYWICMTYGMNQWNSFINLQLFNNRILDNNQENAYSGNKYYWTTMVFGNWSWELKVLEQWSNFWILPIWELTWVALSREMITNPQTNDSTYLLSWSEVLTWNRWTNSDFNSKVTNYSYWKLIPTQTELYIRSWDTIIKAWQKYNKYIGSDTEKVEWQILTNWENVVWITDNTNIDKRIYLNVLTNDEDINVYKKIGNNTQNNNPKLWQFIMKTWKRIHTIIQQDNDAPTCDITYSPTKENRVAWKSVTATLTNCSETITWVELTHTFNENDTFIFEFRDLVWNTWSQTGKVDRIIKTSSSLKKDSCPDGDYSDSYYDWICWTSKDNDSVNEWFDQEIIDAYTRAYKNWITTMDTISKADMDWNLTRIAMAKMLSQYAINVLGKTPDTTRQNDFNDVSENLDSEYDDWVTLAYQLWIMWINMLNNEFLPYNYVTRAEFVTALSRLLYNTPDWEYEWTSEYYTNHMNKLSQEKIITVTDPTMKELRGYVMLMLMRSELVNSNNTDNTHITEINKKEFNEINTNYFTKAYTKNQSFAEIWDLQDLLKYLGFYNWNRSSIYDKETINSVYNFQISMWILDKNETENPARWYLWPATRKALNAKRVEFQQSDK